MYLLSLLIYLLGFCKLVQSAHIRYFCENPLIAHAVLVLKDAFTPRFPSIQSILDSVDFLFFGGGGGGYEAILAKFSNSCFYMLSLSKFFVVFIFCKVGQIV